LQEVTHGAVADITIAQVLIRGAPPSFPIKGFAADKGRSGSMRYDSESFACEIHRKWKKAKIAIPMRRMKYDGTDRNRRSTKMGVE
jgi:hypothetical protein